MKQVSFLDSYPSWRPGYQEQHGSRPDIRFDTAESDNKPLEELEDGQDEAADETVTVGGDGREALGDPWR